MFPEPTPAPFEDGHDPMDQLTAEPGPDEAAEIVVDDLVFACTHLCEVLEMENEALAARDVDGVRELTETKQALARMYEQAMRPVNDEPELLDRLTPERKEELTQLGLRLKELVDQNALLLKARMDACQKVMDVLVDAVKRESTTTTHYGHAGRIDQPRGTENVSITFNQVL